MKVNIKTLKNFVLINLFLWFFVYPVQAVELYNPLSSTLTINQFIGKLIGIFINIVGAVALLMFIYGGATWMFSGGDTQKVKKGKDTLVWATLGLVVIFTARTILNYIFDLLLK